MYGEIMKRGVHFVTDTIKVKSGTHLKAPVGTRLTGGVKIENFEKISDKVYACDLNALGIELGKMCSRGYGRRITPAHNELFINGRPLNISRFPKNGEFLEITGYGQEMKNEWDQKTGRLDGGFYYDSDRPKQWDLSKEIWTFGYWAYDWAPSRERVEFIDPEKMFVKNAEPYGAFTFTVGQRFCFFNIKEEVTEPGDYCVDYSEGKIYFIPFEDDSDLAEAEVMVSVLDKPIFDISDAEDVIIEGYELDCVRGNAVKIKNSKNVTISNCTIHNIGNRAMNIDDSFNIEVSGCHIYDTGDGGVHFYCGERKKLIPSNSVISDCHIHDVARWDRCYEPPIRLYGVGLSAICNTIHDCPHSAVLFGGNEIKINNNEIYRVVQETGDAGAVYGGRDYTFRGNEVCGNYIHHIGTKIGMGTMGIYNDDCMSGTKMTHNVFYRVQRAVFLGGGRDFIVKHNVFVDCNPAIEIDGRGTSTDPVWRSMVKDTLKERYYHIDGSDVAGNKPPYITRYPELADIDDFYLDPEPMIPSTALLEENIMCSYHARMPQKINYTWCVENGSYIEINNKHISKDELKKYVSAKQFEDISETK